MPQISQMAGLLSVAAGVGANRQLEPFLAKQLIYITKYLDREPYGETIRWVVLPFQMS